MKNYDYKAKLNQNRKRFIKRVAGLTVATTLVVGAPVAPSVLSNETLQDTFGVTVAHAAVDNLMEVDDYARVAPYYNEEYDYTRYILYNGSNPILNLDDFDALTYIVKFPDELSYILEDEFFLSNLVDAPNNGEFMLTGTVTDKDGTPFSINRSEHRPAEFVTVNQATNSIEFDFHSFLAENELTSVKNFGFNVPIFQEGLYPIANAEYGFKAALVASGSVDLDSVGGVEQITFTAEQSDEDAGGDGDQNEGDGSTGGDGDQNEDDGSTGGDGDQDEDDGSTGGDGDQNEDDGSTDGDADQNEDDGSTGGDGDQNEDDGSTDGDADQNEDDGSTGEDGDQNEDDGSTDGDGDQNEDDGSTGGDGDQNEDDGSTDGDGDQNEDDGSTGGDSDQDEGSPSESEEDNVIEISDKNDTGDSNGELNNDTTEEEGEKLPDTATNTWTYGLAGAVALLLGVATKIVGRFKRSV